jgi:transcriptional regulator with XRE-family HTH domain
VAFSPAVLTQARKARGLTQEELAVVIRSKRTTVQSWEAGRREPDPVFLLRLSKALRISVEDLNPQPEPQPVSAA